MVNHRLLSRPSSPHHTPTTTSFFNVSNLSLLRTPYIHLHRTTPLKGYISIHTMLYTVPTPNKRHPLTQRTIHKGVIQPYQTQPSQTTVLTIPPLTPLLQTIHLQYPKMQHCPSPPTPPITPTTTCLKRKSTRTIYSKASTLTTMYSQRLMPPSMPD